MAVLLYQSMTAAIVSPPHIASILYCVDYLRSRVYSKQISRPRSQPAYSKKRRIHESLRRYIHSMYSLVEARALRASYAIFTIVNAIPFSFLALKPPKKTRYS